MIITLLILSAMLGLATGLLFRIWTMAFVSLLIAIAAAVALQTDGFAMVGGIAVIVGCLVISQVAYVAGALVILRFDSSELSAQDEVDGHPDHRGKQYVRDNDS